MADSPRDADLARPRALDRPRDAALARARLERPPEAALERPRDADLDLALLRLLPPALDADTDRFDIYIYIKQKNYS